MDQETAKTKYQRASALFAKKDYGAALALLDELIEAFPGNAQANHARAQVLDVMRQERTPRPVPEMPKVDGPHKTKRVFLGAIVIFGICALVLGWITYPRSNPGKRPFQWDFEAGEPTSWTNVMTSNVAGGLTEYAVLEGHPDPADAPHSGQRMLAAKPFPYPAGGKHQDAPHDTLVVRSPTFTIEPGQRISLWTTGGGGGTQPMNTGDIPTKTAQDGFLGVLLRRERDGKNILSSNRSGRHAWVETVFTADALAPFAGQGDRFTLDVVDARHGDWGWIGVDDVRVQDELDTLAQTTPAQQLETVTTAPVSGTVNASRDDKRTLSQDKMNASGERRSDEATVTIDEPASGAAPFIWFDGPEQFAFFTVDVQVQDEQGRPVPNALIKGYCQDWPLLHPVREQFLRTDASGRCALRLARGDWILMAAGGDTYWNGRTGRGLFLTEWVTVQANRAVVMRPTQSFGLTFLDLRSRPCDSDYLRAGITSMAPICAFMDIGSTQDGRCRINTNTKLPLNLFFGRRPAGNQEGYFLFWEGLEPRESVELQPEGSELTAIHFESYDPRDRPGELYWVFDFPYQDIEKRYAFVEFNVRNKGLAWFSPGFANYRPVAKLWDVAYQCDVFYELYLRGLELEAGQQISLSAGGPLTRRFSFLPKPTGEAHSCMMMLGPTMDTHGNELQFYRRGLPAPAAIFKNPIRIRDGESGNALYEGSYDICGDHMASQLQKHFPESAVFELDWDLGPYGGRERLSGKLYAPEFRYELTALPTDHFTVHVPAAHAAKGRTLGEHLDECYDAMARVLGVRLGEVDSDGFYVHPEGIWASIRGQELFYHGFRWWHPRDPASKGWEGAALHEIGHRMVTDAFACQPDPFPLQGHVNEAFASLMCQEAIAVVRGEEYAFIHREGEGCRFFDRLANPDNPPLPPKDNLFFIIQTYMPKRFGKDIHTRFCQAWKNACLVLTPKGYQHNEIVCALFSALGGKNLAWLFNYAEWNLDEAKIADGMRELEGKLPAS